MKWVSLSLLCAGLVFRPDLSEADGLRTLGKGPYGGVKRAGERVVRTGQAWKKLWAEHTAGMEPRPELPKVDFRREMVLAVFMGERRTGGYAIEVAGVERKRKELVVRVRRTVPGEGLTAQVITHPFHFVAAPKSDLPVKFVAAE